MWVGRGRGWGDSDGSVGGLWSDRTGSAGDRSGHSQKPPIRFGKHTIIDPEKKGGTLSAFRWPSVYSRNCFADRLERSILTTMPASSPWRCTQQGGPVEGPFLTIAVIAMAIALSHYDQLSAGAIAPCEAAPAGDLPPLLGAVRARACPVGLGAHRPAGRPAAGARASAAVPAQPVHAAKGMRSTPRA